MYSRHFARAIDPLSVLNNLIVIIHIPRNSSIHIISQQLLLGAQKLICKFSPVSATPHIQQMKHSFRYLVVILFAVAQGDSNHLRRKLPVGGSGSEAAISQFPGVVKLLSRNADSRTDKICSGALIKSDLVVTAASCTYALNDQPADSSSQAIVHGSATNSTGGLSRTWQAYSVHPDYVLGSQTDDIALIKLSEPMDSVETVDARFVWFTDATPGKLKTQACNKHSVDFIESYLISHFSLLST